MKLLGIDTSNYTTSAAVFENNIILQNKMLLPVKKGERGLRQSEVVFHHLKQLPIVLDKIPVENINGIGVSLFPRRETGSYMPCFTVGENIAKILSKALNIPLFGFSHQEGHIAAALYSCKKLELMEKSFLAFHVSGGTTEALIVTPEKNNIFKCRIVGKTLDLNAGQLIDRVGVMLNLNFPCGKELEKLALNSSKKFNIKPMVKDCNCCLSGVENKCMDMFKSGETAEDISKYCLEYILKSIDKMTENILKEYKNLPIVYAGGVMSNSIIKKYLSKKYNAFFAEPDFSSDNAAGISVLTAYKLGCLHV